MRYVLEGSLRKSGTRIRVTAQLVEAETGKHVWAERYDRDLNDIFALQDEISQAIVAALRPVSSAVCLIVYMVCRVYEPAPPRAVRSPSAAPSASRRNAGVVNAATHRAQPLNSNAAR